MAGDRGALARVLTAVENRTPVAEAALRRLYPVAGKAHLVGITGPPGSGKSTLVAALIGVVRAAGRAVGLRVHRHHSAALCRRAQCRHGEVRCSGKDDSHGLRVIRSR